ncbi:probable ATP-dependent RNA helicase Dbp73D [Culicoides brevitarsis]|uniref:probable ATP-dependent RNA helicase Dbp73D n=1 Tax=Culicoides brevitarsis TaxID=469753 RepID=UPI00307B9AAE
MVDTAEKTKETKLFSKLLTKISERKKSGGSEKKKPKKKVEGYNSDSDESSEELYNGLKNGNSVIEIPEKPQDEEEMEVDAQTSESESESESENEAEKEAKLLNALKSKVESKKKLKKERAPVVEEQNVEENEQMDTTEVVEEEKTSIPDEPKLTKTKDIEEALKDSDFQVLGKQVFEQRRKIRSVLPAWLAYPRVISNDLSDTTTTVEDLSYLDAKIKENLLASGVKHLFPVQKEVIPFILDIQSKPSPFWPRDICCSAPTGSGKTLAFAVPIVQLLLQRVQRKVRALVILPVNELAEQVFQVFKQLCKDTKIVATLLTSSMPLAQERSRLVENINGQYFSKVDIVVTTAGRLVEHLQSTEGFSIKDLRFLVIDEADRVMDQIQNDWLYHLNKHIKLENESYLMGKSIPLSVSSLRNTSRPPHKLLFSATLSQDPEKIQKFKLFHPKLFTTVIHKDSAEQETDENGEKLTNNKEKRGDFIGKYTTPANLVENYCLTETRLKPLSVYALLKENNWRRFLCFTNSTDASHRLSFVLQELFGDEMVIEELSSTLSLAARKNVLHKFASFKVNGIISTDALARGIDIPAVDVVISYDAPKHVKTYIHRIGRTARAGQAGVGITLLEKFQLKPFQKIIEQAGKESVAEIKTNPSIEESKALDYANTLKALQKALEKEKAIMKRKTSKKADLGPKNLLDQIRQQISQDEAKYFNHHIPSSWREENIKESAENQYKANKRFKGEIPNKKGKKGDTRKNSGKQNFKKNPKKPVHTK